MLRPLLAGFLSLLLLQSCAFYRPQEKPAAQAYQEDEEVRIGRQFRREAKKHLKFVRNLEVERYIDRVGRKILSTLGPQPFDYQFFVVEDRQMNAFAVPGGFIYVHTGLIERMSSTDELAGVMAHEIVHIKARHMARMSGMDITSLLGLLGVFLGAASGGSGVQAAGALGQALALTRQLSYSRQLEQEADTLGVKYMTQAGFDPMGAVKAMRTMDQERTLNPVDVPPYLMTHPLTQERIAGVETAIRSFHLERQSTPGPEQVRKIHLLLRLERKEADEAVAEYRKLVAQSPDKAEPRHFLALAYHAQGSWQEARKSYEQARALDRNSPGIDRDMGRLYTQMGEVQLAREAFERSLAVEPKEPSTYLYLGELLEKDSKVTEAISAYLMAKSLAPVWPEPYQRLSVAYNKMNRLGDAYYNLGKYFLLQDEDERAVLNLERAAKISGPKTPRGQVITEEIAVIKSRRR
ncbi:MAG: M48 family metalloprotease [Candidatus Binatia bacterium]